jgi:extradiol dioxygenase family protein
MRSLFHFSFNVTDLNVARHFYGELLGCAEGRSADTWVDFDFFGHQISLHLGEPLKTQNTGRVDDKLVPMPHFGLVLTLPEWQLLPIYRHHFGNCSKPHHKSLRLCMGVVQ